MTFRRRLAVHGFGLLLMLVSSIPAGAAVPRGDLLIHRRPAVIAIDADTGARRWRTVLSKRSGTVELAYAAKGVVVVLVGPACGVDLPTELAALDASNGETRWRVECR